MKGDAWKSGDDAVLIYRTSFKVTPSVQSTSAIHGTNHTSDWLHHSTSTMKKARNPQSDEEEGITGLSHLSRQVKIFSTASSGLRPGMEEVVQSWGKPSEFSYPHALNNLEYNFRLCSLPIRNESCQLLAQIPWQAKDVQEFVRPQT